MDKVLEIMEKLKTLVAEIEPMHENCYIKIRRSEVSAPAAFMKGKEEGTRLLALDLLAILEGRK